MKRYNLKATSGSRVKYLNITQYRKNLIPFTNTDRPYATRVRIDENNDLRVGEKYINSAYEFVSTKENNVILNADNIKDHKFYGFEISLI